MSKVKLKRLKINKYRNVRPGTELHFDDGVNLVLGQNGSGKTTLLSLIAAVGSNDFSRLKEEAFDIEYRLGTTSHAAVVHVVNRGSSGGNDNEVDNLATPPNGAEYSYQVRLQDRKGESTAAVTATPESVTITIPGKPARKLPPSHPFAIGFLLDAVADASDDALNTVWSALYDMHVGLVPRFDEALDCFLAMTGRQSIASSAGTPPAAKLNFRHAPKLNPAVRFAQFTPWGLARVVPVAHASPGGELRFELDERADTAPPEFRRELQFLVDAARVIGFSAAALQPEIKLIQNASQQAKIFELEGFSFSFTRRDGATIHHDRLAYGQKRILAYFYYLACTIGYVIADELVNGLHHRWIGACMEAIGARQAFLTSQNPLLFEHVKFESVEQVQTCFVTCKTEVIDGAEQLVWQNMPRGDAVSFFESYQADIESVGDILMTRGLW